MEAYLLALFSLDEGSSPLEKEIRRHRSTEGGSYVVWHHPKSQAIGYYLMNYGWAPLKEVELLLQNVDSHECFLI